MPDSEINIIIVQWQHMCTMNPHILGGLSPCLPKLKSEASDEDYQDCTAKAGAKYDDSALDSKESFCG